MISYYAQVAWSCARIRNWLSDDSARNVMRDCESSPAMHVVSPNIAHRTATASAQRIAAAAGRHSSCCSLSTQLGYLEKKPTSSKWVVTHSNCREQGSRRRHVGPRTLCARTVRSTTYAYMNAGLFGLHYNCMTYS